MIYTPDSYYPCNLEGSNSDMKMYKNPYNIKKIKYVIWLLYRIILLINDGTL